jgi:hypothetical protein
MAAEVTVTINHAGFAAMMNASGVAQKVTEAASEVAAVASALQDPANLAAEVSVESTTSDALGMSLDTDRPAAAVVFTGKGWKSGDGDQWVAGTPNSGKSAVGHFKG